MGKNSGLVQEVALWGLVFSVSILAVKELKSYYDSQDVSLSSSAKVKGTSSEKSKSANEIVNKHLKEVYIKEDAQRQMLQLENYVYEGDLSDAEIIPLNEVTEYKKDYRLKLKPENAAEEVYNSLRRGSSSSNAETPEEELYRRIAKEKWMQEYDEENKRLFFKKIEEFARRDGIIIKFDKNYEIISVEKVVKPKVIKF
jgi:hypothetical protein